jgi:hypothetical protein
MPKNLKTIDTYTESTDLIFRTFKKLIHFVTLSFYSGLVLPTASDDARLSRCQRSSPTSKISARSVNLKGLNWRT